MINVFVSFGTLRDWIILVNEKGQYFIKSFDRSYNEKKVRENILGEHVLSNCFEFEVMGMREGFLDQGDGNVCGWARGKDTGQVTQSVNAMLTCDKQRLVVYREGSDITSTTQYALGARVTDFEWEEAGCKLNVASFKDKFVVDYGSMTEEELQLVLYQDEEDSEEKESEREIDGE